MPKEPLEYLQHIRDECSYLLSASDGLLMEEFIQNETLKRAAVRSLEIIGEASKKVPADYKIKWGAIQWKSMAGMRDRLIHEYMGVNYIIVWDVLMNKITELHVQICKVIDND